MTMLEIHTSARSWPRRNPTGLHLARAKAVRPGPLAWITASALLIISTTNAVGAPSADADTQYGAGVIETVVVTATRRAENVDKVPASIGVLTKDRMDLLGVKSIADAVRFVPGITLDPLTNAISIRGINSTAGAGTTGIYIDDVPIQMRAIDYSSFDTLPAVFDLERIEVLRGPQGTLYGAGSEGGAVRYITPQPSLTGYEGHARAEVSVNRSGSLNYEAGAAVGGPLSDQLAFRVSAWGRRDGGTIDKFDNATGATIRKNANTIDTTVLRGAVAWVPASNLTITLSDYLQNRFRHDADTYWIGASTPGNGIFRNGIPERMADRDHFNLTSLKIDYEFGCTELISNTSYFTRLQRVQGYSATVYNLSYLQQLLGAGTNPIGDPCSGGQCTAGLYPLLTPTGLNLPGFGPYESISTSTNMQRNFVQEIRLQSSDPEARLIWTAGVFYSLNTQQATDEIVDPQLSDITQFLWDEDLLTAWGEELLPNDVGFISSTTAHDRQLAVFLNAAFAVTDKLKVQGGVRYAWTHFDFRNYSDGPENFGFDSGTGKQSETPITFMGSITYNSTENDMQYVSFANGYRIGGANSPFPEASCQADLDALGLDSVPKSFNSDRVTSFEAGSKDRLLGGRLQLGASVYHLTWNRMQQVNYLSSCGFQYIANFGSATSTGFDLEADWLATDALEIHVSVGYTDAHFTKDSLSGTGPGAAILVRDGDALPGAPWTFSIDAQYNFNVGKQPFFVRLADEFASRNPRLTPQMDPVTTQYDPGLVNDPATNFASIRIGTTVHQAVITLFVENLFDSQPQLNLDHMDKYTLLYEASTLRPRTIGLSASYRY